MTLDPYSKVAAVEIAFYVPIFCMAFFIKLNHGFKGYEGRAFLFMFSLSASIPRYPMNSP